MADGARFSTVARQLLTIVKIFEAVKALRAIHEHSSLISLYIMIVRLWWAPQPVAETPNLPQSARRILKLQRLALYCLHAHSFLPQNL